ncbi:MULTISPECIES: Flp pilus assembly protein CpaB [Marinobacterium]|jgi:pilus assembly protein CpaB|uniref:Pilus assembly protein CpaB n=1 Tax=Marinobacterium iners DSM 11526 TaxID=1122198 RepID=A0A1H4GDD3_9GAMM|nr:Flp pilus assembly protein CpaB [Marinobacterium iners]SEB07643.1 pilus assembly protein CpaB [Marinobacterium iners DSM 11526]
MKGRLITIALILFSILAASAAVYLSNQYIQNTLQAKEAAIDKQYEPIEVVVANFDLRPGDVVSPRTVSLRKVPSGFVHGSAIRKADFSAVSGFALSEPLGKGETLLRSHMSQRKGGKFAALIDEGRRAVTLNIDNLSSAAGMLSPNDEVDILLTTQDKDKKELMTTLLLDNIRVLATGVETSENPAGQVIQYNTVTLDLSPAESSTVTHARKIGDISFVLRGAEERGPGYEGVVSKTTILGNNQTVSTSSIEIIIGG